jgi:hypothetical protein
MNSNNIQQMMCNPDILNSMGEKPDMNKLMNCEDLHNVVSDRDLMSKIMNLSKEMGGGMNNFKNMKMPDLDIPNQESKINSSDMNFPDLDFGKLNLDNKKIPMDKNTNNKSKINQESNCSLEPNNISDDNYLEDCQKLKSMGFEDEKKNLELLKVHNGDIKSVLKCLL